MSENEDKRFIDFIAKNTQVDLPKPEGEWREIMQTIEQKKSRSPHFLFSKWFLAPALTLAATATLIVVQRPATTTDTELADFIVTAQIEVDDTLDSSEPEISPGQDEVNEDLANDDLEGEYEEIYLSLLE